MIRFIFVTVLMAGGAYIGLKGGEIFYANNTGLVTDILGDMSRVPLYAKTFSGKDVFSYGTALAAALFMLWIAGLVTRKRKSNR